ncbi:S41 family peptidase [Ornatilinea apprima]|uniref:S41 family peptidase n=1 Tax=Ornatilinea apprima TaxID=1134406 RepID=UPI00094613A4|nr:S41 family peptidase [Ornatilinea apprima]
MKTRSIFLILLMAAITLAAFLGGALAGWAYLAYQNGSPANLNGGSLFSQLPWNKSEGDAPTTEEIFAPFWEAWDIVHRDYIDQPVDDVALMRGAIRGMLAALGDQHTSYMDPLEFEQANQPLNGSYEGIGAFVDTTQEYLTIISPMPNSPAEKAGLKPDDQIIAVDGEDITQLAPDLVLRRVLGPAGTVVVLTIQREGEAEPFDVSITRAEIELASVYGEMVEGENIAYIQLTTFGERTREELRSSLEELLAQNPDGLILDLRYNGGGYLNTAIDVISEFIPKDELVMIEDYGNGQREMYYSRGGGLATQIPLVVLVNEGSASASEITAGAIQDLERGLLVGTTTFGKGSVQNWIPLKNEQGAVRVTIARWYTPDERQIHEVGIEPDFSVEITEEDVENNLDPQLEKAVELLKAQS